jgi:cell wall assembly regulator SMI1
MLRLTSASTNREFLRRRLADCRPMEASPPLGNGGARKKMQTKVANEQALRLRGPACRGDRNVRATKFARSSLTVRRRNGLLTTDSLVRPQEDASPMKAVWKRIHAWLDANAPADYGQLRPGVIADAIQAAEKSMGLKLPADIKASYRVHDGQRKEPGLIGGEGWCLLSLKEMVKLWRQGAKSNSKDAGCVPFAWGGAGDYIFLDFRSDSEEFGRVMVQRGDSPRPNPVAPSFRSWIEDFAEKLEGGEFAYSEEAGEIMYADEIDLD